MCFISSRFAVPVTQSGRNHSPSLSEDCRVKRHRDGSLPSDYTSALALKHRHIVRRRRLLDFAASVSHVVG